MIIRYTGFTKKDERDIPDFAGTVVVKAIGYGDVRLRIRVRGSRTWGDHRIHDVVVRDVLHMARANNTVSESRLMDRGLQIVPVIGFGIKIYDNSNPGRGDYGTLVAVSPQVEGLFRSDVDVKIARKGHRWRYVSRDKPYSAPNVIPNEHTYRDILEPEEPKIKEILITMASTLAINRPLAAAAQYSKGGSFRGGSAAGQMKDCAGSSDESDDEDDEDPPVVIDKSKKSSFTQEVAGLDGNLGSAWVGPAGSHQRWSRTNHRHRRSGRMEIESAESD
jgi:hypothetical protein